jgi:hypothetical protein
MMMIMNKSMNKPNELTILSVLKSGRKHKTLTRLKTIYFIYFERDALLKMKNSIPLMRKNTARYVLA